MPKLEYKIIRSKQLFRNVSLNVKNGEVFVRAPFWVPKGFIENFITEKSDWIQKTLSKVKPKVPSKKYLHGEDHLFFGKPLRLEITQTQKQLRTSIGRTEELLAVNIFEGFDENKQAQEIKDALLRLYMEEGIAYLTEKANQYSDYFGVEYSKIELKKVSSIWGSCSAKNVLSFNRKLIMAPTEIIDYVVIHEVAHLRERNHSSRFWGLVFSLDKQYKEHRRWLMQNHSILTL